MSIWFYMVLTKRTGIRYGSFFETNRITLDKMMKVVTSFFNRHAITYSNQRNFSNLHVHPSCRSTSDFDTSARDSLDKSDPSWWRWQDS